MAHYGHKEKKKISLMTRLKRVLRNKSMWKQLALEGSLVLFVLMIIFSDTIFTWLSKPVVKPNEIIEKGTRQINAKITDTERNQIFNQVRALTDNGKIDEALGLMQQFMMRDPLNAEGHYLIGTTYLRGGHIQSAFDHFQQAVKINPDYLAAHKTLGEIYLRSGNFKSAQNSASHLSKQSDHLQDSYLMESEIARAEGNLDKALEKVQEALKVSKDPPKARLSAYLADLYTRKGNPAKAEEVINKIDPKTMDADGLVTLAKYYLSVSNENKAVSNFKEALKRYPQDPDANYSYGQYLFRNGKFREASEYYKKALAAMPNMPIIAYRTGQSLLAARAFGEAGALIDQMLTKNPNNLLALRLNVQYQLQMGERKKALNSLNQVARLTPNNPRTHLILAELYLAEGVVTLAEKNALKAIEQGEKAAIPWMILGDIYFRRGQFTKALSYYEKVLVVQPDNLSLMLQMGDAYLNLGQGGKAEDLYKKAFARYPKAAFIQNKLAWARVVAGDRAGALAISQKYFNSAPGDTNALAGYVNVLVENNRLDEAVSLVRQNLKLQRDSWVMNLMLGDLYILKKDLRSAADSYRMALKQQPNDVNLMFNIAARYEQINLSKEAESLYVNVQKRFPKNMLFVNHLAWFYIERMNEPQRAAQLVSALEAEGEGAGIKDTIGWYYYKSGDFKSSEYYLRDAVALDPENSVVRGHLALALFGMKKDQEAQTEAKRVMDKLPDIYLREKLKAVMAK